MRTTLIAFAALAALAGPALAQTTVAPGWSVDGPERAGHAKMAAFLGREALWLRAGTHVVRTGQVFADGTIEFDLAPMKHGDFVGVTFRRQSQTNHENVYLRLSRSGEFMALQYAPRINGSSTWQLYPEFVTKAVWPREQWTHVRMEVRGSKLEIYVGDVAAPTLVVDRLRQAPEGGEVAFWARVNDQPDEWAAALSNINIRPAASPAAQTPPKPPAPGFIASWQVSQTVVPTTAAYPPVQTFSPFAAEESGLVNLNRRFRAEPGKKLTAYAKVTLVSDRAKRVGLALGYSDDVRVFVNGEPVYAGVNGWNSRYPQFVSFVDSRFETVDLPLKAGENELLIAVTDDQFFGWGFSGRIDPASGVSVR